MDWLKVAGWRNDFKLRAPGRPYVIQDTACQMTKGTLKLRDNKIGTGLRFGPWLAFAFSRLGRFGRHQRHPHIASWKKVEKKFQQPNFVSKSVGSLKSIRNGLTVHKTWSDLFIWILMRFCKTCYIFQIGLLENQKNQNKYFETWKQFSKCRKPHSKIIQIKILSIWKSGIFSKVEILAAQKMGKIALSKWEKL